jgi:hypothetical protein
MTKKLFLGAVAALALLGVSPANAVPFTLDYSVTPDGPNYQYNFTLVLDNNDSSWVAGQVFNWLIVGDGILIPFPPGGPSYSSPLPPGPGYGSPSFFTSMPPNSFATTSFGVGNGPTLCFGASCLDLVGGYQPTAVGETLTFSGVAPTFLGAGQLLWSLLEGSPGSNLPGYEVATLVTETTPLPAALPLFASGLGALGLLGWRRKRAWDS